MKLRDLQKGVAFIARHEPGEICIRGKGAYFDCLDGLAPIIVIAKVAGKAFKADRQIGYLYYAQGDLEVDPVALCVVRSGDAAAMAFCQELPS